MMPFIQLERRQEQLDAEEQAAIEKEQWIDDEACRLLSFFPEQLYAFRHWNLHPEVKSCCARKGADDTYREFVLRLAYLQAEGSYELQGMPGWKEPAPETPANSEEEHRDNPEPQPHPVRTPDVLPTDFTEAVFSEKTPAGPGRCQTYAARMLANVPDKATDVYLLCKAETDEASVLSRSQPSGAT